MGTRVSIIIILLLMMFESAFSQRDTSYISIAPPHIRQMVIKGHSPSFTIQLTGNYNIGLFDLAANDNTRFWKEDYINGRNFGTRYGYGFSLTGKIPLHKDGYIRLNAGGSFNRFLSNFVIGEDPEGKVHYNVFSVILGIENSFTPDKRTKPYVGIELLGNFFSGEAQIRNNGSYDILKIKNSFRIGAALNLGIEYAINNAVGFNIGTRFAHFNLLLKKSTNPVNVIEIPFNDEAVTPKVPYSGWKQFAFLSFRGGINFYFGMKNKSK
jgi:hypothetical protein